MSCKSDLLVLNPSLVKKEAFNQIIINNFIKIRSIVSLKIGGNVAIYWSAVTTVTRVRLSTFKRKPI